MNFSCLSVYSLLLFLPLSFNPSFANQFSGEFYHSFLYLHALQFFKCYISFDFVKSFHGAVFSFLRNPPRIFVIILILYTVHRATRFSKTKLPDVYILPKQSPVYHPFKYFTEYISYDYWSVAHTVFLGSFTFFNSGAILANFNPFGITRSQNLLYRSNGYFIVSNGSLFII